MAHNCFFLTQIQDYKRIVISFKRLFNIPNIGGFVIWHIIYVIAIFETFSQNIFSNISAIEQKIIFPQDNLDFQKILESNTLSLLSINSAYLL